MLTNEISSEMKNINGIKVNCVYNSIVPIENIRPNPGNPNIHPHEQIEKLSHLIKSHGWRHPITISRLSGFIVSGHARLETAKLLGMESVPVDYQDFESPAQENAVLISDNVIADLAFFDNVKMTAMLKELENVEYPAELTALDFNQIQDYQSSLPKVSSDFFDDTAFKKITSNDEHKAITFVFTTEQAELVGKVISSKGKEWIVEKIIEMCMEVQNA